MLLHNLVNQNFIGTRDEDDDEQENDEGAVTCRALAQRAKAAHLTSLSSVLCDRVWNLTKRHWIS
jgi:hypothetical protein